MSYIMRAAANDADDDIEQIIYVDRKLQRRDPNDPHLKPEDQPLRKARYMREYELYVVDR